MSGETDDLESCQSTCTFDDASQDKVLSVSVTYKQQSQTEQGLNDETEGHNNDGAKAADVPEDAEEHFIPNPPVTPSPSYVPAVEEETVEINDDQNPVLPGWKGYTNNIYIQPIIVNNAACCSACTGNTNERRFQHPKTEDLRAHIRTRQASEWITKHNQRTQLVGSLKSLNGVTITDGNNNNNTLSKSSTVASATGNINKNNSKIDFNNKTSVQHRKDNPIGNCGHFKIEQNHNKISKGFVCRHWAEDFLPQEYRSKEDGDFVPLMVRRYVDKTRIKDFNKNIVEIAAANRTFHVLDGPAKPDIGEDSVMGDVNSLAESDPAFCGSCRKSDPHRSTSCISSHETNTVSSGTSTEIGTSNHTISRYPRSDTNTGLSTTDDPPRQNSYVGNLEFRPSPKQPAEEAKHDGSYVSGARRKVKVALPQKQFPLIDPLHVSKATTTSGRAIQRPHTVGRSAFMTNRSQLPRRSKSSLSQSDKTTSRPNLTRGSSSSSRSRSLSRAEQNVNQVFNRQSDAANKYYDLANSISRASRADEAEYVKGLRHPHKQAWNGTDSSSIPNATRRKHSPAQRSYSEPSRLLSLLQCKGVRMENKGIDRTFGFLGLSTPAQSFATLADGDTDSEIMGLGSEIAYSSDGSAKLDIFLNPN